MFIFLKEKKKTRRKYTNTYTMEIRLICTFIALFYREKYYDARLLLTTLSIRQNGITNISRIKVRHIFCNIFIFCFVLISCFLFLIVVLTHQQQQPNQICGFTRTNKLSFYVKDTQRMLQLMRLNAHFNPPTVRLCTFLSLRSAIKCNETTKNQLYLYFSVPQKLASALTTTKTTTTTQQTTTLTIQFTTTMTHAIDKLSETH